MAEKGLRAWVKEKWVDIGAPKNMNTDGFSIISFQLK